VPPVDLFSIPLLVSFSPSIEVRRKQSSREMAMTPANPADHEIKTKADLEFIHLEEQELAKGTTGTASPVYGIDEAHQKRVMCVPFFPALQCCKETEKKTD
jgi:hypothetical protein